MGNHVYVMVELSLILPNRDLERLNGLRMQALTWAKNGECIYGILEVIDEMDGIINEL